MILLGPSYQQMNEKTDNSAVSLDTLFLKDLLEEENMNKKMK